ncbi:hypothetical protein, partial [Vreelandella glaciei]|uniref:hypothetical protein n=1 Tax=Vreelandella glaciei TaxID=186761 RepID=UPI001C54C7F4
GAELDVGHGTVWVNGDIRYIAMQFSRLEAFLGAGLTDSGSCLSVATSSVERSVAEKRYKSGMRYALKRVTTVLSIKRRSVTKPIAKLSHLPPV